MEENYTVEDFTIKIEFDPGGFLTEDCYNLIIKKILFVSSIIYHRTRISGAHVIKFNGRFKNILYDDLGNSPALSSFMGIEIGNSSNDNIEIIHTGGHVKITYEKGEICLINTREKQPDYTMYLKLVT